MQVTFNGLVDVSKNTKDVVNDLVWTLHDDLPENSSICLSVAPITKRRTMFRATFKVLTKGRMSVAYCSANGIVDAVRCARNVIIQKMEAAKGRMLARRRDKIAADRLVS